MTILEERQLSPASGAVSAAVPAARRAMIDSQLRVSGVNDPAILAAFAQVDRAAFVPEGLRANAYIDRAVPLGEGLMLAAPLVHGRMLSEAALTAEDRVLVVSDSGYLAALVAAMGLAVETIAPADALNARRKSGEASVVLVDGAMEQLPPALTSRLAEGGRLVGGLVERGVTRLATGTRVNAEVALLPLAEIGMPVLSQFAAPKRWSF